MLETHYYKHIGERNKLNIYENIQFALLSVTFSLDCQIAFAG